jgi:hypothetical protein
MLADARERPQQHDPVAPGVQTCGRPVAALLAADRPYLPGLFGGSPGPPPTDQGRPDALLFGCPNNPIDSAGASWYHCRSSGV